MEQIDPMLEGVRFDLLVLAEGFRPVFLRDLALPFDGDALEVRLEPGWGAWLDVVLGGPGASATRPARAAGARVLVDGVPAGALDERGQMLLEGDAPPAKIELLYPGYHVGSGHLDPVTGAPPAHSSGPLWVVLEPNAR